MPRRAESGVVKIEYNDAYEEWDIDSGAPSWLHTAASTREEAVRIARRESAPNDTIKIKGPRMSRFKKL